MFTWLLDGAGEKVREGGTSTMRAARMCFGIDILEGSCGIEEERWTEDVCGDEDLLNFVGRREVMRVGPAAHTP